MELLFLLTLVAVLWNCLTADSGPRRRRRRRR